MRLHLILVFSTLCFSIAEADESTDGEIEAFELNATVLRDAFEEPLQIELLKSGLTPRNAEIAAQNMLSLLIECWNSDRNETSATEQETMIVKLGGQTIVTYKTPCMFNFLANVDELAR